MSEESRLREHEMRGRSSDEVVGRAREGSTPEKPDDTARLRTEIARTREDMSETIDEIQDRLNPRNLMSQARETVKEKTVGRVRQAARNVGQSASGLAEQTRGAAAGAASTVRQNPWPALLIGSGTAWLLMDNARRRRRRYEYESIEYEGIETMNQYESGETRAAYGYDTSSDYGTRGPRTRRTGQWEVRSQFQQLLQRNPLAVGAVAAAVGVAIGLALPETDRENRLMGDARDNLVERAQGAVEKAKQVAGDAAENVAGEAAKQVIEPRPR